MAVHLLFLLLMPALLILGARRSRLLGAIGPTLLSYVAGILWGNFGWAPADNALSLTVAQVTVPLAIPLLLFATDFIRWLRLARATVFSFALQIVGVLTAATLGAYLFRGRVDEWWKLAGMFVGVYTGGTANLTAIGLALGARQETFILANAADIVVSSVYLVFLLSIAQRVLLTFLPAFKPAGNAAQSAGAAEVAAAADADDPSAPPSRWTPAGFRDLGASAGLAVAIVGTSLGLSLLLLGAINDALVILSITTLGILASFSPRIRQLKGAYSAGEYLLLIFCIAIGSTADFQQLTASPAIVAYCAVVVAAAVLIHYALAALFRIDADTVIITSTAGIFSPIFVGPVAAALKNREIVVSGLTTGVVGFAVGNYLGLALAYLLRP